MTADGPTLFIGAPGVTKSVLSLGIALAVTSGDSRVVRAEPLTTGPVLFMDWELSARMHRHRLAAMCRAYGIDIPTGMLHYRREHAPVDAGADAIKTFIVKEGIELVVVDSIGKARSSDPNDHAAAIRMFQAIDWFGVPSVLIDHSSREATKNKENRGMGAVYNDAYIRLGWSLTAAQSGNITNVTATNWKNNFGLKLDQRRWAVEFIGNGQRIDELRFHRAGRGARPGAHGDQGRHRLRPRRWRRADGDGDRRGDRDQI